MAYRSATSEPVLVRALLLVIAVAYLGVMLLMPLAAVFAVSFVFGATAIGWNGVYLSEVARIAPPGRAGAATGASLAMTYAGVVAAPTVFWLIVSTSGSYAIAFAAIGIFTLWRGSYFFRRD